MSSSRLALCVLYVGRSFFIATTVEPLNKRVLLFAGFFFISRAHMLSSVLVYIHTARVASSLLIQLYISGVRCMLCYWCMCCYCGNGPLEQGYQDTVLGGERIVNRVVEQYIHSLNKHSSSAIYFDSCHALHDLFSTET